MTKNLVVSVAALLMASVSWAEAAPPDYGRPGWYAGVGAGTGIAFLEDAIRDKIGGGLVDLNAGGSFNARGGYRLTSWFAVEAMYEGVYNSNIEIAGRKTAAERSFHSFVANLKLILPTWRVHPYFMIGAGAQYGTVDALDDLLDIDLARWDFMLRTAFGIDAYITENWLVNLELAPSVRFADYKNIPLKTTDNVLLTVGVGVQYRW